MKKSYKNIVINNIGYMTIKNSKYVKINSANPLYLIINKVKGYFEKIINNKYLTLVSTNESKKNNKKSKELRSKIRGLISLITKDSDDYDQRYMKIEFDLNDQLPLNKTIEIPIMVIIVRAAS